MKRKLVALIVGVTATVAMVASSHAQGYVVLDNYASSGAQVKYAGSGSGYAGSSFTVGLYYALGDVTGTIPADPSGVGIPGSPLALGSGTGSSVGILAGLDGYFSATSPFMVPGAAAGDTVTIELIAYNGATYADSQIRGHSDPFTMTAKANTAVPPASVGFDMPASGFDVMPVPEPTVLALIGLGAGMFLIRRRR